MTNNRLILIRHGEALHNVHPELWSLGSDSALGLTYNGVKQAEDLGHKLYDQLGGVLPNKVVHSTQIRSIQTAGVMMSAFGKKYHSGWTVSAPTLTGGLRESSLLDEFYKVDTGSIPSGFDFEEFKKDPFLKWRTGPCLVSGKVHGETDNMWEVMNYASLFLQDILHVVSTTNLVTLAVSHHVTISCILVCMIFDQKRKNISVSERPTLNDFVMRVLNNKNTRKEEILELLQLTVNLKVEHCLPYELTGPCENVKKTLDEYPRIYELVKELSTQ